MDYELAIIGAGPAGYSAVIYAARSGITTALFDRGDGGGRAVLSPKIENYAGFESISGMDLMAKMKQHASKYATMHLYEEVKTIQRSKDTFSIETTKEHYSVGAILLCTGTEHKTLNIPGETEFLGKGVSYCATCDGFFFKGKQVAVMGGGNTALMEAIFLKQIGCKSVTLVHRREQLRAEKIYETEAREKQVQILLNKAADRISGKEVVEQLHLTDVASGRSSVLAVDGVFVSVGDMPQNELAKTLGVALDDQGYVMVDRQQRTNIKGVYAAGDITGGVRQVITACAEGAIAALASTEVLGKKYPY
ncbi:MAG TPA: thioredoxin-disulfide reductase [Thermoplasmata archaeon]|nr:MAG TPA: thioredoxin-disulfide reductase [Thermoplasmata archaeon]